MPALLLARLSIARSIGHPLLTMVDVPTTHRPTTAGVPITRKLTTAVALTRRPPPEIAPIARRLTVHAVVATPRPAIIRPRRALTPHRTALAAAASTVVRVEVVLTVGAEVAGTSVAVEDTLEAVTTNRTHRSRHCTFGPSLTLRTGQFLCRALFAPALSFQKLFTPHCVTHNDVGPYSDLFSVMFAKECSSVDPMS